MDERERAAFVQGYVDVLSSYWSNKEFARRLATDPLGALRSCGLELPVGSTLTIVNEGEQSSDTLNRAVAMWEAGEQAGRYQLLLPLSPAIQTAELDEDELGDIIGGLSAGSAGYVSWPGERRVVPML